MLRKATGAVVIGMAVSVVGCGAQTKTVTQNAPATQTQASTTQTRTTAAMTKAQAAKVFLADVAPTQVAAHKLNRELTASTTDAQLQRFGKPYIQAMQAANAKLLDLAQEYPAAATDLKALVNADTGEISDLQAPSSINAHQLVSDINATHSASEIVRSDLGLAPSK